ncbi:MAG: hypothetical protein G01um101425_469 [Candidatus Peregrinibacteria bacterium Gr01-1014_25]|nr:MAG: hypothetical protein G01um101425_469 [Candidatus Peregrinibacteria bacterium Gr01-1014_25]
MKRASTIFLQAAIVLIGAAVLAGLLWEPHLEGVNANATTLLEIYFDDPFLAYVYLGSVPFFVGLYQTIKILSYVRQNKAFSQASVNALRTIQYCALITAGLIVAGVAYIFIAHRGQDDIAGGVAMGVVTTFACIVIATAAAVFTRLTNKDATTKLS